MPVLQKGDKGLAVREVQGLLNSRLGRLHLKADGHFGAMTEQAVKDFQKLCNLSADGIVGPATLKALHGSSGQVGNVIDPLAGWDLAAFFANFGKLYLRPTGTA
jgi:peptidoglycan hydrolase-like protein with peptidoglycan-binding domain